MIKKKNIFIPIITHINSGKGHVLSYQYKLKKIIEKNYEYFPIYFSDEKAEFLNNLYDKIELKNYFIDLDKIKIFKYSFKDIFYNTIRDILKLSKYLKTIKFQNNRRHIFFMESYNIVQLIIFFKFFRNLKIKKKIIVMIRFDPLNGKGLMRIYFYFFYLIFKYFKFEDNTCSFATDSETLKIHLESILNRPIKLIDIPFEKKRVTIKNSQKKYISLPGSPRNDKGLNNFINLIEYNMDQHFMISSSVRHLIKNKKNIIFLNENLSKDEYLSVINNSKLIVLNYDENIYKYATSGIFFDCILLNTLFLVKDNTWMSFICKKYGFYKLIISSQFDVINFINGYDNFDIFKREVDLEYKKFRNTIISNYNFEKSISMLLNNI